MIQRLPGWPEAFASALSHVQNKPFEWGVNDCCLFACNCVLAITGTDLARTFRGYQNRKEAIALIAGYGGLYQLAAAIGKEHGIPELPTLKARRGDVVLFEGGNGPALGICTGDKIAAPGDTGLIGYPIRDALHAWRIG